ncbi:MAG: serine O-acetyltransferase [Saccharofermentans sp.]|nr:serine O-acetyltransferase [Saccharofermentans sp.]
MSLIYDAKQIAKRDPAARTVVGVIFLYSGFHAIVYHRVAHFFYKHKLLSIARWISQIGRRCTGVEIHPGAKIGKGLFIDHGMGVVIGETAQIGDNCTIYHGVTLGGRGHAKGTRRHPIIGDNVLVGAGAKLLGPVVVGNDVSIGANAVVLHDIPDYSTVVGVPGKIVKIEGKSTISHAVELDHTLSDDPLETQMRQLVNIINSMEGTISELKAELDTIKNESKNEE